MQLVSPHGKLPVPNDEDYNFDPNTREFYQPEGLEGRFDIDMFSLMGMEVDNDIDQDDGDLGRKTLQPFSTFTFEIRNAKAKADKPDTKTNTNLRNI